ncbi:SDR family NAD(P)-dependent oxidoreductase [Azorhizobium doebereinerae]|uniref:SDR family NAD(P)-dependent oxidoreductase n=1 Tax=Azorhizobium doebereinerae TaxID=281091 RepID=UPI00040733AB|nr:SDR family oxidoreductase [Azorhizobium doebereinerae]
MTGPDAPAAETALPVFPDLAGKAVLVTGASTGIGAAAAEGFARSGARVAVHYNSSREQAEAVAGRIRAAGGEAVLVAGDVTQADVPARLIAETVAAFGRLDVLVNNAGGLVERTPITGYSDAFVARVLELNVTQVIAFMREGVKQMTAQGTGSIGGGAIINVSSIAARNGGGNGAVLYAAAKGFISTATRGWAKELARSGIRVNAVSPGVIATPFHERFSTPAQMEAMRASVPMERIGTPQECVGAFLFLASAAASGYVTGQILEVNGGQYMP